MEQYTDTDRLNWMLGEGMGANIDRGYITVYLTNSAPQAQGVAGHFYADGETPRDCIDVFLAGKARRCE